MNIHFICRGNVLRSLIAETYLRSLQLPRVTTTSSGTNVDLTSMEERKFFANTIALFKAVTLVSLPADTLNWEIVDIGEGHRTVISNARQYEKEILSRNYF